MYLPEGTSGPAENLNVFDEKRQDNLFMSLCSDLLFLNWEFEKEQDILNKEKKWTALETNYNIADYHGSFGIYFVFWAI